MNITILDVIERVSKTNGKPYRQAAIRGTGKNGDFLMLAIVPDDVQSGEVLDRRVVFGQNGNFVLPY